MNQRPDELYKALDTAIRQFGDRVRDQAIATINKTNSKLDIRISAVESKMSSANKTPRSPSDSPPSARSKQRHILPPLPKSLTITSLEKYLRAQGLNVINNRPLDGGLWVLHDDQEFSNMAKHLDEAGIESRYYPDGRRLKPGPQYEVDPFKRLDS